MPLKLPVTWKEDVSDSSLPMTPHPLLHMSLYFNLLRKILLSDHYVLHDNVGKLDTELGKTGLIKRNSIPLLVKVA